MYKATKRIEVAGAHNLKLDYESKCSNIHGHNWIIYVTCQTEELDQNGMVYDFKLISDIVKSKLDHKYINEVVDFNPTAENIAKYICDTIGEKCVHVKVQESEGNVAEYIR